MYVLAAFEAKSPPTRQDLATLIPNNSLYLHPLLMIMFEFADLSSYCNLNCHKGSNKWYLFISLPKSIFVFLENITFKCKIVVRCLHCIHDIFSIFTKVFFIESCGGLFLWSRIWDLGWFKPVHQFISSSVSIMVRKA